MLFYRILGTRLVFECVVWWVCTVGRVTSPATYVPSFGVKGEGESDTTSHVITDLSKRDWGKRSHKRKICFTLRNCL